MAIIYGADAVYFGGEEYGLRASADNFTPDTMKEGIDFAHSKGKKVYLTMNIIPHNDDLNGILFFARGNYFPLRRMFSSCCILSTPSKPARGIPFANPMSRKYLLLVLECIKILIHILKTYV
jgi:hypothetical protein